MPCLVAHLEGRVGLPCGFELIEERLASLVELPLEFASRGLGPCPFLVDPSVDLALDRLPLLVPLSKQVASLGPPLALRLVESPQQSVSDCIELGGRLGEPTLLIKMIDAEPFRLAAYLLQPGGQIIA